VYNLVLFIWKLDINNNNLLGFERIGNMKTKTIKIIKVLITINAIFLFLSIPISVVFGEELGWQEKWYTKMNIALGFLLIFLMCVAAYIKMKGDKE